MPKRGQDRLLCTSLSLAIRLLYPTQPDTRYSLSISSKPLQCSRPRFFRSALCSAGSGSPAGGIIRCSGFLSGFGGGAQWPINSAYVGGHVVPSPVAPACTSCSQRSIPLANSSLDKCAVFLSHKLKFFDGLPFSIAGPSAAVHRLR